MKTEDERLRRPLDELAWPKQTERLVIRPATIEDVEPTWRYRRSESVGRWLTVLPPTLEEHRSHFESPARLAKTLVIERDSEVIGDLMVAVEDAWAQAEVEDRAKALQAEIGWVLHPDHCGHGFATEAVLELLRICFEELGLRRVTANCFGANEASWRLMERVGMRRELHGV